MTVSDTWVCRVCGNPTQGYAERICQSCDEQQHARNMAAPEGKLYCDDCGDLCDTDQLLSADEFDLNDYNFLCVPCYRRLLQQGYAETDANQ